jgi:O-antigen chain-terminating methyltransferase
METPNPLSLAIFYRTFYVDPTHVKPVHPLTIQYIVESVGFSKNELQFSSRIEPNWWLPKVVANPEHINNINEFNEGIDRLNNLLYGNLDYAIVARK